MTMRFLAILCAALALGGCGTGLEQHSDKDRPVPGDPTRGETLAKAWCASCHDVSPDAPVNPDAGLPSFTTIAADPTATYLALQVFLQSPHADMPNLRLAKPQANDVISFIRSLAPGADRT